MINVNFRQKTICYNKFSNLLTYFSDTYRVSLDLGLARSGGSNNIIRTRVSFSFSPSISQLCLLCDGVIHRQQTGSNSSKLTPTKTETTVPLVPAKFPALALMTLPESHVHFRCKQYGPVIHQHGLS